MISTAQIVQTIRPAAAPLMVQGTAPDVLASDAFSDVLALVMADPALLQPIVGPDKQPLVRTTPDPSAPDQIVSGTEPAPQPIPHHRHTAHLKSTEPQVALTLAGAILDLTVEAGPPAVADTSDLPSTNPLPSKADLLSQDLVTMADNVGPFLLPLQLPFPPTETRTAPSTAAGPATDAQPISPDAVEGKAKQGPQAIRETGQNPVIVAPRQAAPAFLTAGASGEVGESAPTATMLLPVPDPVRLSPLAAIPPPTSPATSSKLPDMQVSDRRPTQPQASSAPDRPTLIQPVQDHVDAISSNPGRPHATPKSPAAPSIKAGKPPAPGPASSASRPSRPEPSTPEPGQETAAPKRASDAQAAPQVQELTRHATGATPPQTLQPGARLTSVARTLVPQAQKLPPIPTQQPQPAAVQSPGHSATKGGGVAEATVLRPEMQPAPAAEKSSPKPAPTLLPASQGAPKLPAPPLKTLSANAQQLMQAPKVDEVVPVAAADPLAPVALAYQILTPSQAFSRFQTMLDRPSGEGRLPTIPSQAAPMPKVDPAVALPDPPPIPQLDVAEPVPVSTTAQSVLTLRAQPDRMATPDLLGDRTKPDLTPVPKVPAPARDSAGPIMVPRALIAASLTQADPIVEAIKPLVLRATPAENAPSTPPEGRSLPTRTETGLVQSPRPIVPALMASPKPTTSPSDMPPVSPAPLRAVSQAESGTTMAGPVLAASTVEVQQTPEPSRPQPLASEPEASVPVTDAQIPSRPAEANPADAPRLPAEPPVARPFAASPPDDRLLQAPRADARHLTARPPETRHLQERPVDGKTIDFKSLTSMTLVADLSKSRQTEATPAFANQVWTEPDSSKRAVTASTIPRPVNVVSGLMSASRMALPTADYLPPQTAEPTRPKPSELAPMISAPGTPAPLQIAPLGTVPQTPVPTTPVPMPMPVAPAVVLASEPDLPNVMGLSGPMISQPERPTRRMVTSPVQPAAQTPSQTPAPVHRLEATTATADVPAIASTLAKAAKQTAPIVDERAAAPAAPTETSPSAPPAGHPVPAGPPVLAHAVAASAAPPHPAAPADHAHHSLPKGFSTNLAHSVLDSGHSRAELILEPAELGRLRFDLVTHGDQVQVNLSAERPETLELLRRHADELRQEFRASGLDAGTLSFGQWGKGAEDRTLPEQPGAENPPADPTPLTPITLSASRRPVSGSGLDLRL